MIKERDSGKEVVVCSGRERVRNVFLSEGNEVVIRTLGLSAVGGLPGQGADDQQARFIIKYEGKTGLLHGLGTKGYFH